MWILHNFSHTKKMLVNTIFFCLAKNFLSLSPSHSSPRRTHKRFKFMLKTIGKFGWQFHIYKTKKILFLFFHCSFIIEFFFLLATIQFRTQLLKHCRCSSIFTQAYTRYNNRYDIVCIARSEMKKEKKKWLNEVGKFADNLRNSKLWRNFSHDFCLNLIQ